MEECIRSSAYILCVCYFHLYFTCRSTAHTIVVISYISSTGKSKDWSINNSEIVILLTTVSVCYNNPISTCLSKSKLRTGLCSTNSSRSLIKSISIR